MIASGTFKAHGASDLEGITSSKKGSEGVRVLLQLDEGPDKGATIEWKGWLGENTIARTAESLALLGYDGSDPATVRTKQVSIVIEKETYDQPGDNGGPLKTYERAVVRWINDPSGPSGGFVAMSPAQFQGAKDRLAAALTAAKAAKAKPTNPEDEPRF